MTKQKPWTIRNTSDLRTYVDMMSDVAEDLRILFVDIHDRPKRTVKPNEVMDCLAHLVYAIEMFLIFAESKDHPLGSPGYGLGHILSLSRQHKFFAMGHLTTMGDLEELDRIGPNVNKEMMYDMVANVQRILGMRGEGEKLSEDDEEPDDHI